MNIAQQIIQNLPKEYPLSATWKKSTKCAVKDAMCKGMWEAWKYKSMLGHVTPDWELMSNDFKQKQAIDFNVWFNNTKLHNCDW